MKEFTIELRNGKKSTYHIKEKLKANGFRYNDRRWYKTTKSRWEIFRWKHIRGIQCLVYVARLHARSNNYRTDYFVTHKPTVKDKYHCAYCGRLLPKERLVVDHIIPIQKAQTSGFWQRILSLFCPEGVNDPHNLTTACRHCNSRKGTKTGLWVLRGYIGKSYISWLIVHISLITAGIYCLMSLSFNALFTP